MRRAPNNYNKILQQSVLWYEVPCGILRDFEVSDLALLIILLQSVSFVLDTLCMVNHTMSRSH